MATRVGIALGSNLGDRLAHLRNARELLRGLAERDADYLQAPIYRSTPVDCPSRSPDFFNTVIEISYAGEPHDLLVETQKIEKKLGRETQRERNAPRVIDVDILYFEGRVMDSEHLTLPHPRMSQRRFVIQPLHDIRPEMTLPGGMVTVDETFRTLETSEPPLILVSGEW